MAPKVDMKGPMTSHRAWVNGVIKRAEKFLGGNPDGLITSGNQEAAKELIEEIELAIEEVNLLVEWYDNVHDISRRAENTIDELRKALKIFETKGAVASAVSTTKPKEPTTLADEEFNRYFFTESCPKLLQKLSLDDGMKCFLEWKDQYELYLREYEGWCSHSGTNFKGVAQFIGRGA